METKVTSGHWAIDQTGQTWVHLMAEDGRALREYITKADGRPLRMKLTEWREKRSLSANAYAWTLLNKLSAKLGIPSEEIYYNLIKDVGGNTTTVRVPFESLDMLRKTWKSNGLGWRVDVIGATAPGKVEVLLYYGSSVYDAAQMGRLIDLIIEECKAQDIEYLPPEKIAAMLGEWDEKQANESP